MKRIFLLALLLAVTLSACSQNPNVHKDSETQPQIGADQLRKDIGEMLLVGFRGTTITEQDPIVRDIRKYHVGSVILFEYDAPSGTRHRNISSPQQIKNLCADLQKYSSEPLLIGIDQEGGNVTRLRSRDGRQIRIARPVDDVFRQHDAAAIRRGDDHACHAISFPQRAAGSA